MKTFNVFTSEEFAPTTELLNTIHQYVNTNEHLSTFARDNFRITRAMHKAGVAVCTYSGSALAAAYPDLHKATGDMYNDVMIVMIGEQLVLLVNMDRYNTAGHDAQLLENLMVLSWIGSGRLAFNSITDAVWHGESHNSSKFVEEHLALIKATCDADISPAKLTYLFTRITPWGNKAYHMVGFEDPRYPFANKTLATYTL